MFDSAAFQAFRRGNWGLSLQWHLACPSTQSALREKLQGGSWAPGAVLGAETQSAGRGRWGRTWEGHEGLSLLFSLELPALPAKGQAGQAPLVLGLGLQRGLMAAGLKEAELRWPNDICWRGKKFAGLLVEQEGDHWVLGLGLNVAQDVGHFDGELAGRAASMKMAGSQELRREPLLAKLLWAMENTWTAWGEDGFEPLRLAWENSAEGRDGALLEVMPSGGEAWSGHWAGLDPSGALKIQVPQGSLRLVHSGELRRLHYP